MRAILTVLLCLPLAAETTTRVVAEGFERPVWIGAPPDDRDHLWVVEQAGKIWKLDARTGEKANSPVLDISSRVSRRGNEEGLLGLAFPADFATSGRFYINYTGNDETTYIQRIHARGPEFDAVDDSKSETLFEFKQPWRNHNGGWLGFGPDGYLYVGTGDGGAANDPHGNGQKLDTLLGKLLRVDVSPERSIKIPPDNPFVGREGALGHIWAYGLRNPWRCSFDRKTGDLWIGDVGQNRWEEINFVPADEGSGANFGWRQREGNRKTPGVGGARPEGAIDPVYVYDHGTGPRDGLSVTGGYVYRGPIRELQGRYIFADYQNRRIWSFVLKAGKTSDFQDHTDDWQPQNHRIGLVSSFGEDPDGHLYFTCLEGTVMKVIEQ